MEFFCLHKPKNKLIWDFLCLSHILLCSLCNFDTSLFPFNSIEYLTEHITPKLLFSRHILDPQAVVSLCPCTAVVSGIEKCGKTTAVRYLLNHAIHSKYTSIAEFTGDYASSFLEESLSVENRECLSCYKVIIWWWWLMVLLCVCSHTLLGYAWYGTGL